MLPEITLRRAGKRADRANQGAQAPCKIEKRSDRKSQSGPTSRATPFGPFRAPGRRQGDVRDWHQNNAISACRAIFVLHHNAFVPACDYPPAFV